MGFLGSITKAALGILEMPVAVAKDFVSLGGLLSDEPEAYSVQKLKEINKDYEKAKDSLEEI